MTDPTMKVGDLVRPVTLPNATPKPVEEVLTEYGGDIPQPLPEPHYIVNGSRFLQHELLPLEEPDDLSAGQKGGPA